MSMTRRVPMRGLAALIAACVLCAAPVAAQNATTTGAIRGHITGTGGAPLPDATITGHNVNTGFERVARAGSDGQYALVLLPPGTYTVQSRMIGFRRTRCRTSSSSSGRRRP